AIVMFTLVRHPGGLGQTFAEVRGLRGRKAKAKGATRTDDDESETAHASLVLPRPASAQELANTTSLRAKADGGAGVPLEVRDVSVRFGGLVAVDSASLTVDGGRITGLIGPNGAGKSTLFNAISGFVRPTKGRVLLHGTDITDLPPHRRAALGIGRTFQQIGLVKDLTVTENLLLAQHRLAGYGAVPALAYLPGVGRGERDLRQRAEETLHALQFERFA